MAPAARTIEYRHNYPLDPLDVVRVFNNSGIRACHPSFPLRESQPGGAVQGALSAV